MSDSTSSAHPDRIESDLKRTRERMDNRLTELQDRLSPGQIMDELMGYVRGSEGGEFARDLMANVKANPMPAAVAAIGLAWLMASSTRTPAASTNVTSPSTSGGSHDGMLGRLRQAELGVMRNEGEAEDTYQARYQEARGTALGLTRDAQETAHSFAERIQNTLSSAKDQVTKTAHDVRDSATSAVSSTAASVRDAASQASDWLGRNSGAAQRSTTHMLSALGDNPVVLGIVSLAAGAMLAAIVPQSDSEQEALGGIAAQARDAARGLAQQATDRGGRVAQQVMDAAKDSAEQHGLSGDMTLSDLAQKAGSGELIDKAKSAVSDTINTAEQALREQGLQQSRA